MAKEKDTAAPQKPAQKGPGGQQQPAAKKQPAPQKGAPKGEAKPAREETPAIPAPPPRLREHYRAQVVPDLMKKYGGGK